MAKCPTTDAALEALDVMAEMAEAQKAAEEPDIMATIFVPTAHRNECALYRHWAPLSPPVSIPRVFFSQDVGANQSGLILMQDLSEGTKMVEMVPGLRLRQAETVLKELAKLHAWSLLHPGWAEKLVQMPVEGFAQWPLLLHTSAEQVEAMAPQFFKVSSNPLSGKQSS